MLGQTFVYRNNTWAINSLHGLEHPDKWLEIPSESLVESGLRHPAGKTFRASKEDGLRPGRDYVCDQSAARASAGGIERNSTPTR
jgi:hypothetical protein